MYTVPIKMVSMYILWNVIVCSSKLFVEVLTLHCWLYNIMGYAEVEMNYNESQSQNVQDKLLNIIALLIIFLLFIH